MKETMFVIATKGRNNTEVYLKCSDKETKSGKVLMDWTTEIDDSYADFSYTDIEKFAKSYFKNFKKWYIKEWVATF